MTPTATAPDSPPPAADGSGGSHPPPAGPAEHWLARALRILAGDVRPDDYLVVPEEVQADHDREMNRLLVEEGIDVDPVTRQELLAGHAFRHLYFGKCVARWVTADGILVLAVGGEAEGELVNAYKGPWPDGFVLAFAD